MLAHSKSPRQMVPFKRMLTDMGHVILGVLVIVLLCDVFLKTNILLKGHHRKSHAAEHHA